MKHGRNSKSTAKINLRICRLKSQLNVFIERSKNEIFTDQFLIHRMRPAESKNLSNLLQSAVTFFHTSVNKDVSEEREEKGRRLNYTFHRVRRSHTEKYE